MNALFMGATQMISAPMGEGFQPNKKTAKA